MKKHDYSLDAIKGFSCILMIIAHTPIDFYGGQRSLQVFGGLAPVLFFAVSGITTIFQSQRKNFISLLLFYLLFAVLGFSYNAIWRPNLWTDLSSDVPQIIALGVLTIFLIEKYLKPNLIFYFSATILVFLIHFFISTKIPDFPLRQFVFNEGSFSFFPWIFAFFAGVFAYRCKNSLNLLFSLVSTAILLILFLVQTNSDFFTKYDMTIGYFLLSLIFIFFTFYVFRKKKEYSTSSIIVFFGKHSFLFLYVHLFFINVFVWLGFFKINILLIWSLTLGLTYYSIKILTWLNTFIDQYFEFKFLWLILISLTVIIPILISSASLIILSEIFIGILFASNYKKLSKLTSIK